MTTPILRSILILFILLLGKGSYYSQNLDSLINLTNSPVDSVRINALYEVSISLGRKSDSTSLIYAKKLQNITKETNDPILKIKTYHALATSLQANSNYLEAVEYFRKGRELAEEENIVDFILRLGNGEGVILREKGDFKGANDLYFHLLKIAEQHNNTEGRIIILSNIASIYFNKGENEKSLKIYKELIKLDDSLGDAYGKSIDLNNMAGVYFNMKKLDSAYLCFQQALHIKQALGDTYGAAISSSSLGKYFLGKNQLDSAYYYLKSSLDARVAMNDVLGLAWTHMYLGEYYSKKGSKSESEVHFNKALNYAKQEDLTSNIAEIHLEQANMYERFGDYENAYHHINIHHALNDSLLNQEALKDMANLEFKYQTEKKTLEIENLKKDKAIKNAELKNEKEINKQKTRQQYLAYAAAAFFILFGMVALLAFVRKRKDNKIISAQKTAVEEQKGQIEEQKHMLEEKNQEIIDSINYAKRIQSAILPPKNTFQQYLPNAFVLYKPKDIVAGDFYWLEHHNNKVLFAAADCTGHGVPGAMVSVICNNGLNKSVNEHGLHTPGEILNKTRELVIQEFSKSEEEVKDGMDIALCSIEPINDKEIRLEYAGANNPLWIIRKGADSIEEIKANKQPIGNSDHQTPFTTHQLILTKGDSIYIFSDGYADQFGGEKGKKFKAANFKRTLLALQDKNMLEQKEAINITFEEWKGSVEQLDDVCVIGVKM